MKFTILVLAVCTGAVALVAALDIRQTIADAEAAALGRQESSLRTVAMALDYARDDFDIAFNADGSLGRIAWRAAPRSAITRSSTGSAARRARPPRFSCATPPTASSTAAPPTS